MLSLSIVSVTAYIVATLLRSAPIYESLLERILTAQKSKAVGGNEKKAGGQKVLNTFTIMNGSVLEERCVQEITWPDNCLLIALERNGKEMIPRGKTKLMAGMSSRRSRMKEMQDMYMTKWKSYVILPFRMCTI